MIFNSPNYRCNSNKERSIFLLLTGNRIDTLELRTEDLEPKIKELESGIKENKDSINRIIEVLRYLD